MGIGQVLTMPIFFAGNAIYPIALMPGSLQHIARVNPLACLVDELRAWMIVGGHSVSGGSVDLLVLETVFLGLVVLAARLSRGIVQ